MRREILESPPVSVLYDAGLTVRNISWFSIGDGMGRLKREKFQDRRRTENLGTIHGDIATLSMFGLTVKDMVPILGEKYPDLTLYSSQLKNAFVYPAGAFTRRLFQRGLVEVVKQPAPLDLTKFDERYLSYRLDGKTKEEIKDLLGFQSEAPYREQCNQLRYRTGWQNEHCIALAGLMNGQLKIFHSIDNPEPEESPQVPPTELPAAVVPPSEPSSFPLDPPFDMSLTIDDIRHRFMDDPDAY